MLTICIILLGLISTNGYLENRYRIDDIQDARADSCRQTYEGIREVFQPFFPVDKNGDPLPSATDEQLENLNTFNDTVDRLKGNCTRQTQSNQ